MSILILTALGLIPFVVGWIVNFLIMADVFPWFLATAVLILIWGFIAYKAYGRVKSVTKIVIFLNIVALVVLILIGVQELVLQRYWFNFIGRWSQNYYLPFIFFGFLFSGASTVFAGYCVAFILMVIASLAGCLIKKRKMAYGE